MSNANEKLCIPIHIKVVANSTSTTTHISDVFSYFDDLELMEKLLFINITIAWPFKNS